jgi:flavin-dependent dehydrogenase
LYLFYLDLFYLNHQLATALDNVIVIGGGLGGLVTAISLAREGVPVTVVEKKSYPFHKVCGEYVSNEVLPFLQWIGADPQVLEPACITRFQLSSPAGRSLCTSLDLGGFGVSRYVLDHYLYQIALGIGVEFRLHTSVDGFAFADDAFEVSLSDGTSLQSKVVVGAFGKRANLDRQLDRPFFRNRSPYVGVKYHFRADFPRDLIALHNFEGGYAGVVAIEDNKYNLCYLTTRQNLKSCGSIPEMEEQLLARNPFLRHLLREAEFLYSQPEVINEISFAPKTCVEDHVLMCGDAAGMITPLCGNGMAMAIHSAKVLSAHLLPHLRGQATRAQLEEGYRREWQRHFARRLQVGRAVQKIFGHSVLSEMAIGLFRSFPAGVEALMRRTHGQPF